MTTDLKLFMILVGYRPRGFNTEQHDVIFVPGTSIENDPVFLQKIRAAVPLPKSTQVHIDAYVEVTQADGYAVSVVTDREAAENQDGKKLFYVNLGGYKYGHFQEYHKSVLLVLDGQAGLKKRAMSDPFVAEMDHPHPDAKSHVDDMMKLGVDIEDSFEVQERIDDYFIKLTPNPGGRDSVLDPVIKGYLKLF